MLHNLKLKETICVGCEKLRITNDCHGMMFFKFSEVSIMPEGVELDTEGEEVMVEEMPVGPPTALDVVPSYDSVSDIIHKPCVLIM